MEVQTRNDSTSGIYMGLHFWKSVKEAHDAYQQDKNIWKISWDVQTDGGGGRRQFVEKTTKIDDLFSPDEEELLCSMHPEYKKELSNPNSSKIFWVERTTIPENWEQIRKGLSEDEIGKKWNLLNIKGLYTDEEFVRCFC